MTKLYPGILLLCVLFSGLPKRLYAQEVKLIFAKNDSSLNEKQQVLLIEYIGKTTLGSLWKLTGTASSSGTAEYNLRLSKARVNGVKQLLMSNGVAVQYIDARYTGETFSKQNLDDPEDRLVKIEIIEAPDFLKHNPLPEATKTKLKIELWNAIDQVPIQGFMNINREDSIIFIPGSGLWIPAFYEPVDAYFSAEGFTDSVFVILPSDTLMRIELLPKNIAKKWVLNTIYFYPNSDQIVPESLRALDYFYEKELKGIKDISLEIRGHINWPRYYPANPDKDEDLLKLSVDRAEAVKRFLQKRGIPESRMKAIGLGSTQMLFPNAVSESEQAQNRRVEIILLKNDE